jgi:hypothetical protein
MKWLLCCVLTLLSASCASAGIINGDFEAGNTGFTTAYTYSHGDIGPQATYDVVDNPAHSRPHDSDPVSYTDHTTGHGLMMAINGAETPNVLFWGQTVAVDPNQDYLFAGWVSSWFGPPVESFHVIFNGTSIGTVTAPTTPAVWVPFSFRWNSGSSPSAAIELRNLNTDDIGDDFAIDDLSIQAVPEPTSLTLFLSGGALGLGWMRRRRGM